LIGKARQQCDLPLIERAHLGAVKHDYTDHLAVLQKGYTKQGARPSQFNRGNRQRCPHSIRLTQPQIFYLIGLLRLTQARQQSTTESNNGRHTAQEVR